MFGQKIAAALVSVLAVCLVLPIPASAAPPVDLDGDGVADTLDIDDDGDGIIDVNETVANFQWATYNPISGSTATGTIGSNPFTYTASTTLQTTPGMYSVGTFPARYNVPNANPTIKNTIASSNTLTFTQPILNPMVVFSSIGNPSTPVPVQFDRPYELLWSTGVAQNTTTRITGTEGFAILRFPGEHTTFSFDYLANETYVNFAFGADPRAAVDTDSDGIVDSRDLDSDDDGIPDNVEAQTTAAMLVPSGADTDQNGLDDRYETTPGAGAGITRVDTDSDGTVDALDVDSDGDGTRDVAESGLGLTDADADGRADGPVGTNGLADAAEAADGYADVNGLAHDGTSFLLADTDDDTAADGSDAAPRGQDLDYRDNRVDCNASDPDLDCDLDGRPNGTDPHPSAATATADSMSARVGVTTTHDVLANDDYLPGSNTTITRRSGGNAGTAGGTVSFDATTGLVSYRPAANEGGSSVTVGYSVCHTAGTPVCANAVVTVNVAVASSDLAVVATDAGPLAPGAHGGTAVTVSNAGPSDATNVVVVYSPPAGVTADMANLSGNCIADTPTPGKVTCAYGTMLAADSGSVLIPVIVGTGTAPSTVATGADVDVTSDSTDPVGSNSTDQPADVTVAAASADLAIVLDAVPTLAPGATGQIDLDVHNNGPSPSASFTVTYTLPPGVALDTAGANPNACTRSAVTVTCPVVGPLAPGAHVDVRIPVKMLLTQPTSGPIDPATAAVANRTVADPVSANDSVVASPVIDLSGDSDGDGVSDQDEMDPDGTGRPVDSDGDGIPDYLDKPGVVVTGDVFRDLNRNGVHDAGEPDISGVLVKLVGPGPDGTLGTGDDVTSQTTRTASPYRFTNVSNGVFDIVVDRSTLPAGVYATDDTDGGADSRVRVEVAGAAVVAKDFGANYAVVSGVFTDDDGAPLANATISFTDAAGRTFTTTTDAEGNFRFEGSAEAPLVLGTATLRGRTADGKEVVRTIEVARAVTVADLSRTAAGPTPAPSGTAPGELAFTGGGTRSSTSAALCIIAGVVLVLVARRRRA